ncbi:hypothetical protein [Spirosoma agri]|uniref:Uncharacterized protein n=1 Tax=Spirosoma agri TaxID=1987381 RepID=A0A6M0ITS4_9BACT|nr:hypothetical protein [Spirosoma agri]NEU70683.1 hypothetical protein [Spirosoma agri]
MTIAQQVQFLKVYSLLLTGLIVWLGWRVLTPNQKPDSPLTELTVERINIVEPNGQLKMVLSNRHRQHPGLINGQPVPSRQREAGLLFFNSSGDECGGLVYDGTPSQAGMALSMDQFRGDQLLQVQYDEEATSQGSLKSYGLKLWDRPESPNLAQQQILVDSLKRMLNPAEFRQAMSRLKAAGRFGQDRLFVGRTKQREVGLFIHDAQGRPRIKLYVDATNQAKLEVLDQEGHIDPLVSTGISSSRGRTNSP